VPSTEPIAGVRLPRGLVASRENDHGATVIAARGFTEMSINSPAHLID
jgi:hypothetical protein